MTKTYPQKKIRILSWRLRSCVAIGAKTNIMKKLLFYFFLPFLTTGCLLNSKQNAGNSLHGTWRLYDIEPKAGETGGASFTEMATLKRLVKEGSVLCFFKDGNYTELKGNGDYQTGRFAYSAGKSTVQLIREQNAADPMEVKFENTKNGRQMLSLFNAQHNLVLKFMKEAGEGKDDREAPFYPTNNLWRIKPKAQEDSARQLSRLTNYLKHVALVLKAAKESKGTVVSFEFSQGPVKIYNGGIGIHPYGIVPESWKNTFFNEADAAATYRRYQDYLRTSSYKGAGTGDWVEDDYNILLSMYADLQQETSKNSQ
jgi:hypothetical protein